MTWERLPVPLVILISFNLIEQGISAYWIFTSVWKKVKVCDICGDAVKEDLLDIRNRYNDVAEHTYSELHFCYATIACGKWWTKKGIDFVKKASELKIQSCVLGIAGASSANGISNFIVQKPNQASLMYDLPSDVAKRPFCNADEGLPVVVP
ncbi:hypothetical protein Acr_26g0003810 [Actinidia rufa]|uniref:Uncharacterized protein n=1 Tax=Actinidia rufa TaxID=165716 RepID=A0A7J0H292_9ERIC|nr:hypothetical protein Acr_26g0003810 [Actinidia rufa]